MATRSIIQSHIDTQPPPRLTGNAQNDLAALSNWLQQFYNDVGLTNYEVSGLFEIDATDVNVFIPFASNRRQPDNNYYVTFGVQSFAGAPPLSALQVTNVTKGTDGFTVTINTAPGAGNSVTMAYSVRR